MPVLHAARFWTPPETVFRWPLAGISELGVVLHIRRNPSSCTRTRPVVKRCEHAAQASRAHRAAACGQDTLHNVRARPGLWDAHVQGDSRCCNSIVRSVPAACRIVRLQVRVRLSPAQLTPIAAFSCPQHQPRQVHRGRHHHQQGRPHHQLASQHAAFIGRVRVAQQVNSACRRAALFAPYTCRLALEYRSTRGSEDARVSTGRSSRCWEHSTWHLSFVRQ